MKFKFLMVIVFAIVFIGLVHAESFTAQQGTFAYKEVENYTLNGFNFTIPVEYDLAYENDTHMFFDGNNNTLNISVIKNGKIKEVNSTKNITASDTMFGSVDGYLVDRNGSYTFSYMEGEKLISISSRDMTLMIGVIGKD
ncbi:hypothetical protein [Methanobrevibacter sp.]|uniref:hypothetical protein n=1 Tax=Methanobrevibacter sp. TaxID=66852 RepID=UPI00389092AF